MCGFISSARPAAARGPRLVEFLLLLGLCLGGRHRLPADEVHYRDSAGELRSRSGTIMEYGGDTLTLQTSGRRLSIPAAQVAEIISDWPASYSRAVEQMNDGQYAAAIAQFREAFAEEQRAWVRPRILADVVVCFHNAGQFENACVTFLQILQQDPQTPYLESMPLVWQPLETPARLATRARAWLAEANPPAIRLLAASWLLTAAADRAAAEQALRQLARGADSPVALLAQAQIWRNQLVTVTPEMLQAWQESLAKLPAALRGGPTYLMGQAQAKLDLHPDAELTLLRVAVLHPRQRTLGQAALFAAAKSLQAAGATAEARLIYQQAAELAPQSGLAQEAMARAKELPETSP